MFKDIYDLQDRWTKVFCEYSYNNEKYAQLCMHLVLGQIYKRRFIVKGAQRLDGRVSIAAFWDSSGGKSAPYGFVKQMLEAADLDVADLDDYTDAGLIGTWREAEEHDDEENGELVLEPGILQTTDVLHFDEASTLFMETTHTKKAVNFLEKALNPIGTPQNMISKKLARGPPIEFYSSLSLFLTSYIPEHLGEEFLNKGLMQRVIVLPKRLTFQNRIDNIRLDASKLGIESVVPEDMELLRTWFTKEAQDEWTRVRNGLPNEFNWDSVREYVKTLNVRLLNMTTMLDTGVQAIATSIISRYCNHMYVIATHSASVRGDTKITKDDIDYAYRLIKEIMDYLLPFLEMDAHIRRKDARESKLSKQLRSIYASILQDNPSDDGWVLKKDLWSRAEKELKTSSSTLYRMTRDSGLLVEATIKRKKYVKIE
jgi:hypothetical protein